MIITPRGQGVKNRVKNSSYEPNNITGNLVLTTELKM